MRRDERAGPAGAGVESRRGRAGFSLVEVTLALLVVAVGMTAVFSLFPEAMKRTRSAVSNTETALFADYVFETLNLTAGFEALDGNVTASMLPSGTDDFKSEVLSRYVNRTNFYIRTTDGRPRRFVWIPDNYGLDEGEMSRQYLQAEGAKTAVFTYALDMDDKKRNGSTVWAVLKVWPGEYGADTKLSDLDDKDARIYYREILPPK